MDVLTISFCNSLPSPNIIMYILPYQNLYIYFIFTSNMYIQFDDYITSYLDISLLIRLALFCFILKFNISVF